MAQATAPPEADTVETWEIQVAGGVQVWKKNKRTGEYEHVRVHGTSGPRLLHISEDDRLYNQELISGADNAVLDPFTNGSLAKIEGGEKIGLTDEQLIEYFELEDEDAFREAVADIPIELTIRRLRALSETKGTVMHLNVLIDAIEERFKAGGTQPTVAAMFEEDAREGEKLT